MGHSASIPCRHCFCPKDRLFDPTYNVSTNCRRHAQHIAFLASLEGKSDAEIEAACKATGWRPTSSPLAGLRSFDPPQQIVQEPYHLLLENLAKPLFFGFYQCLKEWLRGVADLRFHALDYPRGLSRIAFPFNSRLPERFGMSQVRELCVLRLCHHARACSSSRCALSCLICFGDCSTNRT